MNNVTIGNLKGRDNEKSAQRTQNGPYTDPQRTRIRRAKMSLWFDKNRKYWKYTFETNKVRYCGHSKISKEDAALKMKKHKAKLSIGIMDLQQLRDKYHEIYDDRQFTLADIIDMIMADLQLPYTYNDLVKIIQRTKNNRHISSKLRAEVLNRDNFTCQWCGARAPYVKLHIDHIIPVARGGTTEERNLQVLCSKCNAGKSDRALHLLTAKK